MKNIAIGVIPDDLLNIVVTVEWTPGEKEYKVSLLTANGDLLVGDEYLCLTARAIDYTPQPPDFEGLVMRGLAPGTTLSARLTRTLALFSHFKWLSPMEISREDREKYGAAA
ncbi:hypothetical protein [Streptomyces sp. SID14515]|uniref:hypothetical protein n=1 Tax=Streptomyces sp. SID14515 TaxID=2706074 RepID=UPI0013C57839|nr:hypothetical protein [Streptomyces sp. SID14515]NEB42559.1 hypothetical protein [Streptomyces sp. SID14515]